MNLMIRHIEDEKSSPPSEASSGYDDELESRRTSIGVTAKSRGELVVEDTRIGRDMAGRGG